MILAIALSLFVAAPLSGTVRSIDGAPIKDAVVTIQQGGRTGTAKTDQAGAFTVGEVTLPAVVEVTAPGFAPGRRLVEKSPADFTLAPSSIRESVIVTGLTSTTSWRSGATGETTLSSDDLEKVPSVTLDEALHVVSGFSLFRRTASRASNPTTHGVTMRGLSASGASRGLVLLDGVPLNDGFGAWVTWTRLPDLAVDRVEIARGAEGETFGSDALGGVIGVVTRAGLTPLVSAGTQAGSAGTAGVDLAAGRTIGRVAVFGAASGFRTAGVIPVEPVSRGPVDQKADAHWVNGFGRVTVPWRNKRLTVSVLGGRDNRGNGTVLQVNHNAGGTFAAAFDAAGAATNYSARVSVTPNSFYQTFSQISTVGGVPRSGETLTSRQFIDTTTTRAVAEIGRVIPRGYAGARLAIGRATSDFTVGTASGTTTVGLRDDSEAISAYAAVTPISRLTIGAGARREWRAAPTLGDSRDVANVGRVTASWSVSGPVIVRGSAATSHRWPTLNELVRNFNVGAIVTQANPNLRPERGRSGDVAVTIARSRWQVSAGGFWAVLDDAIANVTLSPTLRERRNTGEAHANGAELDGAIRLWRDLRIRGSATYSDATFRNSIEVPLEGRRLPQVPRLSGAVSADMPLPFRMVGSGAWHAVSSQFDDDRNVFRLARAYQFDCRLAGRVREFGWHVDVENAFDSRIEAGKTPLVTLAPGRIVRVGLTWTK